MTAVLRLLALFAVFAAAPALAQSVTVDFGDGATSTGRIVQLILLLTVLSLAPSILVMVTSFTRIVVVLSFLRSALGVQQTPPNAVLISLALFLTAFVMAPTLERSYRDGLVPLMENRIGEEEAFKRTTAPVRDFMLAHVREQDLRLFTEMAAAKEPAANGNGRADPIREPPPAARPPGPGQATPIAAPPPQPGAQGTPAPTAEVPLRVLVPAFMISELRRAFEIGFLLFLPFLIIDMVVASLLMSMGMMMLPPVMISLPFKLIFFVLVDGWYLVAGSLVKSYGA